MITGGGQGIGRALALAFGAEGAHVVITGRRREKLEAVMEQIVRGGGKALGLTCDVTHRGQVEGLDKEIREKAGTVQVLINNAGIAPAVGFLEMEDGVWDEVLKINLTGTYHCCKVFLPGMIASKWGRIINVASTVAKVAYSHISAYTTSKHAVLGLTRALAIETARLGVTVNALCPGYVDTEMTQDNARRLAEKMGKGVEDALGLFKKSSPQNRLIAPEEVAKVALLLASEAGKGITGQAINIDGGAVMV